MLFTALLLSALSTPARAQDAHLSQAGIDAHALAVAAARVQSMKRSLDADADQLDAALGASALRAKVARLRVQSGLDPAMAEVYDVLDSFYAEVPRRAYAAEYQEPLLESAAEELRYASARASSPDELIRTLRDDLVLPLDLEKSLSEGIPLAKWSKMGVVKRFLYKHRLKRPKHYTKVTPQDLIAGKMNVEVGIELTGTAVGGHRAPEDKDWCFFIDGIEVEISPEWILTHPKMYLPKTGETVRVRGWTYYDNFHPDEVPRERPTLWELHPAVDVAVLKPAPAPSAGTNP